MIAQGVDMWCDTPIDPDNGDLEPLNVVQCMKQLEFVKKALPS